MVIHEALTGQLPFVAGKSFMELCPQAPPALGELLTQCLKQNAAERPASAIDVYLQLQELGKASGILLLPPGAMDKLLAARGGTPSSAAMTAPPTVKVARFPVWLALLAGALGVGLLAWLIWYVVRTP
jgi:hypothetical protein